MSSTGSVPSWTALVTAKINFSKEGAALRPIDKNTDRPRTMRASPSLWREERFEENGRIARDQTKFPNFLSTRCDKKTIPSYLEIIRNNDFSFYFFFFFKYRFGTILGTGEELLVEIGGRGDWSFSLVICDKQLRVSGRGFPWFDAVGATWARRWIYEIYFVGERRLRIALSRQGRTRHKFRVSLADYTVASIKTFFFYFVFYRSFSTASLMPTSTSNRSGSGSGVCAYTRE